MAGPISLKGVTGTIRRTEIILPGGDTIAVKPPKVVAQREALHQYVFADGTVVPVPPHERTAANAWRFSSDAPSISAAMPQSWEKIPAPLQSFFTALEKGSLQPVLLHGAEYAMHRHGWQRLRDAAHIELSALCDLTFDWYHRGEGAGSAAIGEKESLMALRLFRILGPNAVSVADRAIIAEFLAHSHTGDDESIDSELWANLPMMDLLGAKAMPRRWQTHDERYGTEPWMLWKHWFPALWPHSHSCAEHKQSLPGMTALTRYDEARKFVRERIGESQTHNNLSLALLDTRMTCVPAVERLHRHRPDLVAQVQHFIGATGQWRNIWNGSHNPFQGASPNHEFMAARMLYDLRLYEAYQELASYTDLYPVEAAAYFTGFHMPGKPYFRDVE